MAKISVTITEEAVVPYPSSQNQGAIRSWNRLYVDGQRIDAGQVEITWERGRRLDEKKSPGADYGTVADNGVDLADIRIRLRFYSQAQFDAWMPIYERYFRADRKLKLRNATTVVYPSLAAAGITQMHAFKESGLRPVNLGVDGFEVSFTAKEWNKKVKLAGTGGAVKPKVDIKALGHAFVKKGDTVTSVITQAPERIADAAGVIAGWLNGASQPKVKAEK